MTSVQAKRAAGLAALLLLAGCGDAPKPPAADAKTPAPKAPAPKADAPKAAAAKGEHDHEHEIGPHGGTIFDIAGGKYHGEFCMDHGQKEAVVHILGGDGKTSAPVKATDVVLSIKQPAFTVDLKAAPRSGEKDGLSSAYLAKHDAFGKEQDFAGTMTFVLDGKPHSGDFKEEAHAGHDHGKKDAPAKDAKPAPEAPKAK